MCNAAKLLLASFYPSVQRGVMQIWLRLFYLVLIVVMLVLALAPGTVLGVWGSGENRHAFAFLVLPIASSVAWPRIGPVRQFLFYSAIGGGIEIAQGLIHVWHSAKWSDWFVDMGAAALALGVVTLVRWLARN